MRKTPLALAALLALTALSACSPNAGAGTEDPVGDPAVRVAAFIAGSHSNWDLAHNAGLEDAADDLGVELTVFDGQYDPSRQYGQIEQAMVGDRFDAFAILSLAPTQHCEILKQASESGIDVVTIDEAICGRGHNSGDDLYEPGTLAYVGGNGIQDRFLAWADEIVADHPGPQKMLLLTGPEISNNSQNSVAGVTEAAKNQAGFEIIVRDTDFSRATAYEKARQVLQADPDITIIGGSSDLVQGAIQAATEAGLADSITFYIAGGDQPALDLVADGTVKMASVDRPYSMGKYVLQTILAAADGAEPADRVVLIHEQPGGPSTPFMREDSIGDYQAEF